MRAVLEQRGIPPLLDRQEMLDLLLREEYGYLPPAPDSIRWEIKRDQIRFFCAGKAKLHKVIADCRWGEKHFSFPFSWVEPTVEKKLPFFVHINFRSDIPDRYQPTEELVDNGFAVLSFCYKDISSDDGDMTNGLAGVLYPDGKREADSAGKIAMWAWAAQRLMDFAYTLEDKLDLSCGIVCGHSRLGKTALLAAATDERFAFAYSNDSGCSGAAITRGKQGETVNDICRVFPYWFCENYKKYEDNEPSMPFDQHYLLAAIAPRYVLVGSAVEDIWSDPMSEQLACLAAAPAFADGMLDGDKEAEPGDVFFEGRIGYHMRRGAHYFSREDWLRLIAFVKRHHP